MRLLVAFTMRARARDVVQCEDELALEMRGEDGIMDGNPKRK